MIRLLDFPRVQQTNSYGCSVFCIMSVLEYYGADESYEKISTDIGLDERTGAAPDKVVNFFKSRKFKIRHGKLTEEMLIDSIESEVPVIIPMQAYSDEENPDWSNIWDKGHYMVLIGYSDSYYIFADPLNLYRDYIKKKEFRRRWHDTDGKRKYINYGIIIYGKK